MLYVFFRIIAIVIGYCFGLIQTGYFLGKINRIDIRDYGSGSSGATNMTRTLGPKMGLATFLGDTLKPMIAYLITALLFVAVDDKEVYKIICLYAATSTVIGHIFPFYLNFKGGKGVASLCGVAFSFVICSPNCIKAYPTVIVALILFILILLVSKYVSLGSIVAALTLLLMHLILGQSGKSYFELGSVCLTEWYIMLTVIVCIVLIKHIPNIRRLLNGNENKLGFHKK